MLSSASTLGGLAATLQSSCFFLQHARAVSLPSCQSAAPPQATLTTVKTAFLNVSGFPFGVEYATHQKDTAFATLASNKQSMLAVLNTSNFNPTLSHQIPLPPTYGAAAGVTLSHTGKQLYIASGPGLIVVDTKLAAEGSANAIIGILNGTTSTQQPGKEAIEVTLTHNDKYAFVSQEYGVNATDGPGNIDVFELSHLAHNNSIIGMPIGFTNLGLEVVGSALGRDGDILYATAENETNSVNDTIMGYLNVLSVAEAQDQSK